MSENTSDSEFYNKLVNLIEDLKLNQKIQQFIIEEYNNDGLNKIISSLMLNSYILKDRFKLIINNSISISSFFSFSRYSYIGNEHLINFFTELVQACKTNHREEDLSDAILTTKFENFKIGNGNTIYANVIVSLSYLLSLTDLEFKEKLSELKIVSINIKYKDLGKNSC